MNRKPGHNADTRIPALSVALTLIAAFAGLSIAARWSLTVGPSPVSAAPQVPADGTESLPPGTSIQTILSNMTNPIAMAFDPQGRLFYTEKTTGFVRLFANGSLQATPVITYSVDSCSERGLLGIAVDPLFTSTHYIYVYYTAYPGAACGSTTNRVARFTENNGVGTGSTDIFSSTQTAGNHNGGNIHFGPDGKLFISIGENANPPNAQNVTVKNGKMHRINSDGTIPSDNPVFTQTGALPSLYVIGLRNSFDFTFDPLTPGRIFASENGPSCDDEMNRIQAGYNYGWRGVCEDDNPSPQYNTIAPLWYLPTSSCCEAPTGITVYSGNQIPQWQNHLFMATYNSSALRHFYLNPARTLVTTTNIVQGVSIGTDIETGPDGALWYIEGGGYSAGTLKRIVGLGATNTPTRTPTLTPTSTPGAVLRGHVLLQGRATPPAPAWNVPLTLTLRPSGGSATEYTGITTDQSGYFTVNGLSPGSYDWRVKNPHTLARAGAASLAAGTTTVEMGTLREGDADNNNCVALEDFTILKSSFGKLPGDPGYDPNADFDGDNSVGLFDFDLLKSNFGACGDAPVLPTLR